MSRGSLRRRRTASRPSSRPSPRSDERRTLSRSQHCIVYYSIMSVRAARGQRTRRSAVDSGDGVGDCQSGGEPIGVVNSAVAPTCKTSVTAPFRWLSGRCYGLPKIHVFSALRAMHRVVWESAARLHSRPHGYSQKPARPVGGVVGDFVVLCGMGLAVSWLQSDGKEMGSASRRCVGREGVASASQV
jgi:hypothetical protein